MLTGQGLIDPTELGFCLIDLEEDLTSLGATQDQILQAMIDGGNLTGI